MTDRPPHAQSGEDLRERVFIAMIGLNEQEPASIRSMAAAAMEVIQPQLDAIQSAHDKSFHAQMAVAIKMMEERDALKARLATAELDARQSNERCVEAQDKAERAEAALQGLMAVIDGEYPTFSEEYGRDYLRALEALSAPTPPRDATEGM